MLLFLDTVTYYRVVFSSGGSQGVDCRDAGPYSCFRCNLHSHSAEVTTLQTLRPIHITAHAPSNITIEVNTGLKNPHCFVFSDDPLWVRENFKASIPMTVVDIHGTQEAHEGLRLMRECQHFVIANSSLSWWAAWLGSREGKRVVAPKVWFKTSKNDTADLVPGGWRRV